MSTNHGRNEAFCKRYKDEGREAKNKARRIRRHEKNMAKKAEKLKRKSPVRRTGTPAGGGSE